MSLFDWMNEKIKLMEWYDISLVKLSAAAFALMVAKLWAPLLSLDWYWYLVIALVAAIIPLKKMFSKPPEMSI